MAWAGLPSPLSGISSPFGGRGDLYAAAGFSPEYVADLRRDAFRVGGTPSDRDSATTFGATDLATMVDSDGVRKWRPNALFGPQLARADSEDGWAVAGSGAVTGSTGARVLASGGATWHRLRTPDFLIEAGGTYTLKAEVTAGTSGRILFTVNAGASGRFDLSGVLSAGSTLSAASVTACTILSQSIVEAAGGRLVVTIRVRFDNQFTDDIGVGPHSATTGEDITVHKIWAYRSDLGGMADNPETGEDFIDNETAGGVYVRREGWQYDGAAWVRRGDLVEPPAAENLLHSTNALVTQSVTVTAQPYTLQFTGTGTVTLSGASTAGPLVGTGAGAENQVTLTFTPSAGSLTLTVSGDVTDAQLEAGSVATSYMPNFAGTGTATRAAETAALALPHDATAMSGLLDLRLAYADTDSAIERTLLDWRADANNRITLTLDTSGANTGKVTLTVVNGGTPVSVTSTNDLTPGHNVAAKIAWRITTAEINVALNGTAATAVANAAGVPNVSAVEADLEAAAIYAEARGWTEDIGDAGVASASQ